jgi:hypothetical protein
MPTAAAAVTGPTGRAHAVRAFLRSGRGTPLPQIKSALRAFLPAPAFRRQASVPTNPQPPARASLPHRIGVPASRHQRSSAVGTWSMSSNTWFSPTMPQMNV